MQIIFYLFSLLISFLFIQSTKFGFDIVTCLAKRWITSTRLCSMEQYRFVSIKRIPWSVPQFLTRIGERYFRSPEIDGNLSHHNSDSPKEAQYYDVPLAWAS